RMRESRPHGQRERCTAAGMNPRLRAEGEVDMRHVLASIGSMRSPWGRLSALVPRRFARMAVILGIGAASLGLAAAQAPPPLLPPPVPPGSPITPPKAGLGPVLF